jgi:hypothetical protein
MRHIPWRLQQVHPFGGFQAGGVLAFSS